jgi:putative DNA primase/helicase
MTAPWQSVPEELNAPYKREEAVIIRADAAEASVPQLELDPAEPLSAARQFVGRHFMTANRLRALQHHAGAFYQWNGRCYELADIQSIRSKLYSFLDVAKRRDKKGDLVPFKPTMARVTNVVDAIQAVANLNNTVRAPAWLANPEGRPLAGELVACANGLLHLATGDLLDTTPAFFSLNALDFAFDPDAPPPAEWLQFLDSLWGDDMEAIETLQEWCGYCLTTDTRQQKILLVVGPKRSGKGTIARVLTRLLGQPNVCGPTLASLGQTFGLAPFIGKQLAIISDARLGGRADQQAIAERLLSISGEDGITIDRKFIEPWTGTLSTRFMIMTNELPEIADASGAFASRFIVLTMQRSFFGNEDHGLTGRLLSELPGILNWAIEGWRRLQERGYFRQPASSAEAIQELEDLSSPVGAFLRERCETGPGLEVPCALLYAHWRVWCEDQGRDYPGNVQVFGRKLKAACRAIKTTQLRVDGERERRYEGVGVRADIPLNVTVRAEAKLAAMEEGAK